MCHNAEHSNHNQTEKSSCVIQGVCHHQHQRDCSRSFKCTKRLQMKMYVLGVFLRVEAITHTCIYRHRSYPHSLFWITAALDSHPFCLQNPSSRCKCVASDWWLLCLHWIAAAYQTPPLWIFMHATWAELALEITCVQSGLKISKCTQAHVWCDTWKQRLRYNVNPNTWDDDLQSIFVKLLIFKIDTVDVLLFKNKKKIILHLACHLYWRFFFQISATSWYFWQN